MVIDSASRLEVNRRRWPQLAGASCFGGCGQLPPQSACGVDCSLAWMLTGEMFSLQLDRRRSFVIKGTVSKSAPLSVTIAGTLHKKKAQGYDIIIYLSIINSVIRQLQFSFEFFSKVQINNFVSLFDDDLKLRVFRIVKNPNGTILLQDDLTNLQFCATLTIYTQIGTCRCEVLTISRKRAPYLHTYCLNISELIPVNLNKDLGIFFDESLSFNEHYIHVQNRTSSMLDSKISTVLKSLY